MALGLKALWSTMSTVGTRKLGWIASKCSSTMSDTVFYYHVSQHPGVEGCVALTIDDGLARGGPEKALVDEVRTALKNKNARATFFLCSDYLAGLEDAARALLEDGHEFANHCPKDREYASLPPDEFETQLLKTSQALTDLTGRPLRWFRAPQAKYTASMKVAVTRAGLRHALGDVYCDDWAIADSEYITRTLLKQVQPGSIIILHFPERGFREHSLEALRGLLEGLEARNLRCVTLSELVDSAEGRTAAGGSAESSPAPSVGAGAPEAQVAVAPTAQASEPLTGGANAL